MAITVSNEAARAANDAVAALCNGGTLEVRTGAKPANVDDAATGTLLGTLSMNATAFGVSSDANPGAIAAANSITGDTSADASGTAGWFRIYRSGGSVGVIDGTITVSAGGGDLELNTVTIVAGGPINVTALDLTHPEG